MARLLGFCFQCLAMKNPSMIRSIVLTRSLPHGITQLHSFCTYNEIVARMWRWTESAIISKRSGRCVAKWFVRGARSASHGSPDSGRPQSEAISTERLLTRTWLGRALLKDDQARPAKGGTHSTCLTSGGGGGRFHGRIEMAVKKDEVGWSGDSSGVVAGTSWRRAPSRWAAQHIRARWMLVYRRVQQMP
jgi:hypothetical protein